MEEQIPWADGMKGGWCRLSYYNKYWSELIYFLFISFVSISSQKFKKSPVKLVILSLNPSRVIPFYIERYANAHVRVCFDFVSIQMKVINFARIHSVRFYDANHCYHEGIPIDKPLLGHFFSLCFYLHAEYNLEDSADIFLLKRM